MLVETNWIPFVVVAFSLMRVCWVTIRVGLRMRDLVSRVLLLAWALYILPSALSIVGQLGAATLEFPRRIVQVVEWGTCLLMLGSGEWLVAKTRNFAAQYDAGDGPGIEALEEALVSARMRRSYANQRAALHAAEFIADREQRAVADTRYAITIAALHAEARRRGPLPPGGDHVFTP